MVRMSCDEVMNVSDDILFGPITFLGLQKAQQDFGSHAIKLDNYGLTIRYCNYNHLLMA